MITGSKLQRRPRHFYNFTGFEPEQFNDLLRAVQPVYQVAEQERLTSRQRVREVGGGGQFSLTLPERLLATLMDYRLSVTGTLLSSLFNLDLSNLSNLLAAPTWPRLQRGAISFEDARGTPSGPIAKVSSVASKVSRTGQAA